MPDTNNYQSFNIEKPIITGPDPSTIGGKAEKIFVTPSTTMPI